MSFFGMSHNFVTHLAKRSFSQIKLPTRDFMFHNLVKIKLLFIILSVVNYVIIKTHKKKKNFFISF